MSRPLRILISAGPTREPIDPVRFLSNYSTGYMGACLTAEAIRRGHRVTLVSGPATVQPPRGARVIRVEQARQMQAALRQQARAADAVIMTAAVSDFRPVHPARTKLPRRRSFRLQLEATPDIIGTLPRAPGQVVVGFAVESSEGMARARAKLKRKRLDLIVGQHLSASPLNGGGSPFGRRAVKAFVLGASGAARPLGTISKPRLARVVLDEIERLWYGGVQSKRET